jgi:glutamate synthase domain-containing protein 3
LNGWNVEISKIRKVMPRDYRGVLDVIAKAKADGLNEEQTNERVMEAARG